MKTKAVLHLASILLLLYSEFSRATTLYVCSTCPNKTINNTIQQSKNFDTIIVKKGLYKEYDIIIDKPLVLIAAEGVVVDGQKKGEIMLVLSDHVTIEGFTIINVGSSYTRDFSAIRIRGCKNFTIRNNTIKDLFFGIYLEKASDGKIDGNTILGNAKNEFNSGNGIQLWYCNRIEIKNNLTSKVRDGIYLEFSNFCKIMQNRSIDNVRYGLHFMFSSNNSVYGNRYQNNGAGVAIMFSKQLKMHENTFIDNWGPTSYGILLKEVNDAEISGNVFMRNTTGINIEGSNRIIYLHNDFINNGWAINSRGANYSNKVNHNNFLNNSFDLVYRGALNQNDFSQNYWSDYTGYDLDRDGRGDVPYRPVKLFSYIVNNNPETILFLRSLFVYIIDFSEKISPVLTPENIMDTKPFMKKIDHDKDRRTI